MYIKMIKYVFISLIILFSCRTYANLIIDVEFTSSGKGSGSFTGIDLDGDGVLTYDELTAFTFVGTGSISHWKEATIDNLFYLQDFYYLDRSFWIRDDLFAFRHIEGTTSWGFRARSLFVGSVNTSGTVVTEPASLAIFTLGLIGLASRRFKKQS